VKRDGKLVIEKSLAHQGFSLPVSPKGDFEVTAAFTNSDPTGTLCVHLPLGSTGSGLLFKLDGSVVGFEFINGKGWVGNESTTSFPRPQAGREHLLAIKVVIAEERVEVASTLDGQPLLRWKGPLSVLKCPYASPHRSAISVWESAFAFRSVRFRSLTGETKIGAPPKAKAEP
jgi:hypothetical protein